MGSLFGGGRKRGIDCPAQYRAQFDAAMARAQAALGLKWTGERIRVVARPGTAKTGGRWGGPLPGTKQTCGAYFAGTTKSQTIVLYVDPKTGAETDFELAHECGECVLASHGVRDPAERHRRLKAVGLY